MTNTSPALNDSADIRRTQICAAIRAIPRGEVRAYGEVASAAGLPGRARLVAKVLTQSTAHDLPWHRVLRADGRIAFPANSEHFEMQRRRLLAEGVSVVNGRIAARAARDLDAMLWHP
ncbi:MAG: Methylated-DNA--protein-cysteine methyltransferase [Alphaproteobacteria bacterium ADurb.BinA280]|jgi:methylated-DNA-protein-cysteine methyltransferase related protein|nr:MGMT family protein [Aquimonas sp.]OPZ11504.1 MAG: Methylated-DNA--protein-cysteine methyltransferase [Alphaproteobacteria bacterium ADurb.BinA280]